MATARSKSPARRKPPARTRKTTASPTKPTPPATVRTVAPAPELDVTVQAWPEADPTVADARDRAADILDLARERADTLLNESGESHAEAKRILTDAEGQAASVVAQAARLRSEAARKATSHRIGAARQAHRIKQDAAGEARRLLTAADKRTAAVLTGAEDRVAQLLSQAQSQAGHLLADAETEAGRSRADSDRYKADAQEAAAELTAAARSEAEEIRHQAQREADEIRSEATAAAVKIREAADAEAAQTLESATDRADELVAGAEQTRAGAEEAARALTTAAKEDADRVRRSAQTDAERAKAGAQIVLDDARREAAAVTEAAQRSKRLVEEDTRRLRQNAAEDAQRLADKARAEADRLRATARQEVAAERSAAQQALVDAQAREQDAADAQKTANELLAWATDRMRRATSRTEQRLERKRLKQTAQAERRNVRQEEKDRARQRRQAQETGRSTWGSRFGQLREWTRALVRNQARRVLVAGPIAAPMGVAWWSQMDYAKDAFGWMTIFAIGFAAAWELTTAFTGWMYHQARKAGDAGTIYRIMTWVFAAGAAAMNYSHHCGPGGKPTQAAVAFATMSIVGMVLWELYAALIHRTALREQGLAAKARPRIGIIRWIRYPRHSFTAWSLAITDASLSTLDRAWTRAETELVRQRVLAAARGGVPLPRSYRVVPVSASPTPSGLPGFVAQAIGTVRLERIETGISVKETGARNDGDWPGAGDRLALTGGESAETPLGLLLDERNRSETGGTAETSGPAWNVNASVLPGETGENGPAVQGDPETEIRHLLNLIRSRKDPQKVSLDDAMRETGRPKSTAAKRLAAARDRYRHLPKAS